MRGTLFSHLGKFLALFAFTSMFNACTPAPCDTSQECGQTEVCAANICRSLSCGQTLYLKDPDTGACTPVSGCFLRPDQRAWASCTLADPCVGLAEAACVSDTRCQPAYAMEQEAQPGKTRQNCQIVPTSPPTGASVPGQDQSFHPPLRCQLPEKRTYAGCRQVPTLPEPCSALDLSVCTTRSDCVVAPAARNRGASCTERRPIRAPECTPNAGTTEERETACLVNPLCQPVGTKCYCPPGSSCPCEGGLFLGCEHNDRLMRCASDTECGKGQTCRLSNEPCRPMRQGVITSEPTCMGLCASNDCEGLSEAACSLRQDCLGLYQTECSSSISQYYQECPLTPTGSGVPGCLCDNVFQRCVKPTPKGDGAGILPQRSLLITDPAIVELPEFQIGAVLSAFADKGAEVLFVQKWFTTMPDAKTLSNGAIANQRPQFKGLLAPIANDIATWLSTMWHTTALVNRIDLRTPGNCGEARIAFAYNGGYSSTSDRMTIIVELKVPDDGKGCKEVAQRWAELSLLEEEGRKNGLKGIFAPLLRKEHLSQIRTNEFINRSRNTPWELREWHIGLDGFLQLAPAKQAVDARHSQSQALESWVKDNLQAVRAGTALVPEKFLAAAAIADGKPIRVLGADKDQAVRQAEARLNGEGCAGCHLNSTGSAFVHIGERLAHKIGGKPTGRAVLSSFVLGQLEDRARILTGILRGDAKLRGDSAPQAARVH